MQGIGSGPPRSSSTQSNKSGSSSAAVAGKKNEIQELKDDLINNNENIKKEAVRKIIDAMTRGKDVSMLFTDVLRNMITKNMELKKLIYLYIINYAKSKPELVILAINAFRNDASDPSNPLLRSLAVRTMGCIRIKTIVEYLLDPLKKAIKDTDPYVRKTAAICIAKIYETHPDMVTEQGFMQQLEYLLNDGNAMVIANAICAQMQIQDFKGLNCLSLDKYKVQKLRTAMNECNEWGVIYILDALALYQPSDSKETEDILERVVPRLSHINPGVILSATRVIMKYLDFITDPEILLNYCEKLTMPLISLLNMEPEIVFVALKNINLILQKRPIIIEKEIKFFFCNFNDPIYIKTMKIEILIRLANSENIHQILGQLKEHSQEVDVEIAKKSIRAIGRCAIKIEKAAPQCVKVLRECLKSKEDYITQETIIVIRDIFRKYPKDYEGILKEICENLKALDDPEAKAAMIWIIGEYVNTISNSNELLANFADGFLEEPSIVQHQILTSCVKLFLMRANDGFQLVQTLLQQATTQCENPDIRDRGFIYWRLLGKSPELAKKIVYSERPEISDSTYILETELLDILINNIGTLSSVYYKPPESFVKHMRDNVNSVELEELEVQEAGEDFLKPQESIVNKDYYGGDVDIQLDNDKPGISADNKDNNLGGKTPATVQQVKNLLDDDDDYTNISAPSQPVVTTVPQAQQQQQQQAQQSTGSTKAPRNLLDDDDDITGATTIVTPITQIPTQIISNTPPIPTNPSTPLVSYSNIKIPFSECLNESKMSLNNKVNGLNVTAAFQRQGESIVLEIQISNRIGSNIFSGFAIKFAPNKFKLNPASFDLSQIGSISPGQSQTTTIDVNCNGQIDEQPLPSPFTVNCMIKTNYDVFQLLIPCSLSVFITPGQALSTGQYAEQIQKSIKKSDKIQISIDRETLVKKMNQNNIYIVNSQTNPQGIELLNFSCKLTNEMILLLDVIIDTTNCALNIQYHGPNEAILPLFYQAIMFVLKF